MEFYKRGFTILINKTKCMNPKSFHHPEASRDCTVAHYPHDHMRGFGHQRNEIPESIVSGCCLRHFIMRFWFHGMNEIGKLNSILDKKYRHIVSDQIKISFFSIKFYSKPPDIPCEIC